MKSLFVIVCSFIFAFVGQSCTWGGGSYYDVFVIKNISVQNMIHHEEYKNERFDTFFETNVINLTDTSRFCFRLTFNDSLVHSYTHVSNPMGQQAVASSPSFYYELNSDIKEVTIKTVYDFDSNLKSGANINEFFTVDFRRLQPNEDGEKSLANGLDKVQDYVIYNLPSYVNDDSQLIFFLNEKPVTTDTFSVVVRMEFMDGTYVQARTEDVIIK